MVSSILFQVFLAECFSQLRFLHRNCCYFWIICYLFLRSRPCHCVWSRLLSILLSFFHRCLSRISLIVILLCQILHFNARHLLLAKTRLNGFLLWSTVEVFLQYFLIFCLLFHLLTCSQNVRARNSYLLFGNTGLIEHIFPQNLFQLRSLFLLSAIFEIVSKVVGLESSLGNELLAG